MTVAVLPAARASRKLPSWIAGFREFTEAVWSTDEFRVWAAISTLAGALERKVWVRSQGANIYPNLYTFLVGPAGAGKTRVVEVCSDLWQQLPDHHVAPVSLTKASLMDELHAAERIVPTMEPNSFNALLVASKELGALIPNYDTDFLNALTYLYDNIKYDEKRRGNKDPLIIERPQINLIGCTTPSFLLETLPATAWEQGFLSRVILVYKGLIEERKLDLEEELKVDTGLKAALEADLRSIAEIVGKFIFSREAAEALSRWYDDRSNRPAHPRLQNYVTRRPIHAIKLCIIAACDRGAENRVIELEDVQAAIDWLYLAECEMPNLFTDMKTGGDSAVIAETWHWARMQAVKLNSPALPARLLYEFLGTRVPAYRVQAIVEVMLRGGLLKADTQSGVGMVIPREIAPGSL